MSLWLFPLQRVATVSLVPEISDPFDECLDSILPELASMCLSGVADADFF